MKNTLKRVALLASLVALITPFYTPVMHAAPVAQADRAAPPQAGRAPAAAPAVGERSRDRMRRRCRQDGGWSGNALPPQRSDEVTGSEKTVAGLATMRGSQLTVT